jgi:uncharacterized protein YbgA (DUF1722 family)/uncharacterized protein YbbK (DUF523 family)
LTAVESGTSAEGPATSRTGRPRIGAASCLLGEPVRFNAGHSRCRFLTDDLAPHVDWVPYCPEMAIGLGTPRETLRLTADGRLVNRSGTADHTLAMTALPLPSDLDGYVFKAKSPSCGVHGIARYNDNGQPADHRGRGVFAARVMAGFPLLPAEDDGRLNDAVLREAFTERIFAAARLRELLSHPWEPRELVAFHTRHKLQLLARDPARYRQAGRIVADAGRAPRNQTTAAYRELFLAAMACKASRGRNACALQHAFSRISRAIGKQRRADLAGRIEMYRHGHDPLSVPVALLAHYTSDGSLPWLAAQTFLAPFPAELRLRHSI